MRRGYLAALILLAVHGAARAHPGPFDGQTFRGRIGYSADGNFNDPDDWAASPVALAILAQCGAADRLVHFDYNNILARTDPVWEQEHAAGILGAAERYGFARSAFHDCQRDLPGAIASIRDAVNASSAADPLYYIVAGPMEVPWLGIMQADPAKRRFVYCLSHNRWNDGFAGVPYVKHNKRDLLELGVTWIQIMDQNQFLSRSPYGRPARDEEFEPFAWLAASQDPKLHYLAERMRVSTRPDCSDAGITWFLMTGDERTEIAKLQGLLDRRQVPRPIDPRQTVRLEAENFRTLDGCEIESRNDRGASQRLAVRLSGKEGGHLSTTFDEPYTAAAARYDVEVRYAGPPTGSARLTLEVGGRALGESWSAAADPGWTSHTVPAVDLASGDAISLRIDGPVGAGIDYLQLTMSAVQAVAEPAVTGPLDDPAALPGQIIVAGANPGYLKHNGGGPIYLAGPDNPEDFVWHGELQPDGTRAGGDQDAMIARLAATGVSAFHFQMFRMKVCNYKDEGDDTHCPFVDHDPAKPLDEDVLNQWDGWLTALENAGIIVDLEFYNDATDVERMGWTLDADGNLPADEARFFRGIVERFKHHKNIIWCLEESANKLPAARTPHFRKLAELVALTDNYHHPILQSFVVPNDPDHDFPEGGVLAKDYAADPNIKLVTWLHVPEQGEDLEAIHREYLKYRQSDGGRFIVLKNETFHHPRKNPLSRRYLWASAMAGLQQLEAYHHASRQTDEGFLRDHARLSDFMEQTTFYEMEPRDDLAAGATNWVLARPGVAYIAYTYQEPGPMGIKEVPAGNYDLVWFDPASGEQFEQGSVQVDGEASWPRPDGFGAELALYLRRAAE